MLGEEGESCWGEADDVVAVRCVEGDEAAVVCVFPHRKLRAGCAPGVHCLFVGPVALCQPLQKIEDEVLDYGVGHGFFAFHYIYGDCGMDAPCFESDNFGPGPRKSTRRVEIARQATAASENKPDRRKSVQSVRKRGKEGHLIVEVAFLIGG